MNASCLLLCLGLVFPVWGGCIPEEKLKEVLECTERKQQELTKVIQQLKDHQEQPQLASEIINRKTVAKQLSQVGIANTEISHAAVTKSCRFQAMNAQLHAEALRASELDAPLTFCFPNLITIQYDVINPLISTLITDIFYKLNELLECYGEKDNPLVVRCLEITNVPQRTDEKFDLILKGISVDKNMIIKHMQRYQLILRLIKAQLEKAVGT